MERARKPGSFEGVATSKFAVPRRRDDVIRRTRLNAFVDAAIGGKGMLIAAPAGYGKTTLVVDWLSTADFAAVWVSLDAWDSELPAFARAVAAAIRLRFDVDVPLGDERFWQPRTIATVLINAIAEHDDYVVLVLDDVHSVESSDDVMTTLGYLIERAPENLCVIMTSRTRPAIPSLSRLIARREVATIGAADLAFVPREVRELLATLGRPISDDEAEALFERTEGWAAALILGAGSADVPVTDSGAANGVRHRPLAVRLRARRGARHRAGGRAEVPPPHLAASSVDAGTLQRRHRPARCRATAQGRRRARALRDAARR